MLTSAFPAAGTAIAGPGAAAVAPNVVVIMTDDQNVYQLQSHHADAAYDPARAQLATRLHQLQTCSGTTC